MRMYCNPSGKAKQSLYWGDKIKKKIRKIFKKSARQQNKKIDY